MKIEQLSLFLENKPGHLASACRALGDAGINIATASLADTEQFGILRLIVEDTARARQVLEDGGFVVKVSEVVATAVADRPGGMAEILDILQTGEINIEYMYAFTSRRSNEAVLVFRMSDPDKAISVLAEKGKNILDRVTLFANNA